MPDITINPNGPLEQTARAIRARLELVFPSNIFTHRWMPARLDKDVWDALCQRMPLVAIGFNRFHRPETTSALTVLSEWSVWTATQNVAGQEAVLFGDRFSPGQFSLMQVAASVLHGHTIPGLGSIQVNDGAPVVIENYQQANQAVSGISLTIKTDLSLRTLLSGDGITPADLTQHIQWSFDGCASVAVTDIITGIT